MIPPQIHYIWLSGEAKPEPVEACIASWRRLLPGFAIRCWTLDDFDPVELPPFARQALELRQWAFASDSLRAAILHRYGGIYLDTDVRVTRPLDGFLADEMFLAVEHHPRIMQSAGSAALLNEDGSRKDRGLAPRQPMVPGLGIQVAILGATAGHPFLKAVMDHYGAQEFVRPDGGWNTVPLAPGRYGYVAEQFGFRWADRHQKLERLTVYPSSVFAGSAEQETASTVATHLCLGGWR